jgi:hypothetical protein
MVDRRDCFYVAPHFGFKKQMAEKIAITDANFVLLSINQSSISQTLMRINSSFNSVCRQYSKFPQKSVMNNLEIYLNDIHEIAIEAGARKT